MSRWAGRLADGTAETRSRGPCGRCPPVGLGLATLGIWFAIFAPVWVVVIVAVVLVRRRRARYPQTPDPEPEVGGRAGLGRVGRLGGQAGANDTRSTFHRDGFCGPRRQRCAPLAPEGEGPGLPPGGHIEENEDPVQAALREVCEETGLRAAVVPTSECYRTRLSDSGAAALHDHGGGHRRPRAGVSPSHRHDLLLSFGRSARASQ